MSLHISAAKNEIAKNVLMPGDPLRAKKMSERYLQEAKQINNIRGMLGFTGVYQSKLVTILASGMGAPSMGIYSYELFNEYDVDTIIRVGSCGAVQDTISLHDIVIGQTVSTDSNYLQQFNVPGTLALGASWDILQKSVSYCAAHKLKYHVGNILCSDFFYDDDDMQTWKKWAKMGLLAIEMESAALYANALRAKKNALTLLTVSDQIVRSERCTVKERESAFHTMFEVALATIA